MVDTVDRLLLLCRRKAMGRCQGVLVVMAAQIKCSLAMVLLRALVGTSLTTTAATSQGTSLRYGWISLRHSRPGRPGSVFPLHWFRFHRIIIASLVSSATRIRQHLSMTIFNSLLAPVLHLAVHDAFSYASLFQHLMLLIQ